MIEYDKNTLIEMLMPLLHLIKETNRTQKISTTIPKQFLNLLEIEGYGTLSKDGKHFEFSGFGEIEADELYNQFLHPESVAMQNDIAKGIFESMNELLLDEKPEFVPEENTKKVFTLKIMIKHVKPPVWRRIKIPGHLSLEDLKVIIFLMFDWSGSHLYAFTINGYEFPDSDIDFMGLDDSLDSEDDLQEYQLSGVIGDAKRFTFTYDFGDDWEHEILVEKVEEIEHFSTPEVLKVVRESPVEDIGGPYMMDHIRTVLKNEKHPEYREIYKEYGDIWDIEIPDKEDLNNYLKDIYPGGNLRIVK